MDETAREIGSTLTFYVYRKAIDPKFQNQYVWDQCQLQPKLRNFVHFSHHWDVGDPWDPVNGGQEFMEQFGFVMTENLRLLRERKEWGVQDTTYKKEIRDIENSLKSVKKLLLREIERDRMHVGFLKVRDIELRKANVHLQNALNDAQNAKIHLAHKKRQLASEKKANKKIVKRLKAKNARLQAVLSSGSDAGSETLTYSADTSGSE